MTQRENVLRKLAILHLAERRKTFANKQKIDNSALYAGSPMYYDCLSCNATIEVPEDWTTRPKLCPECQEMKNNGWLEQVRREDN